MRLASHKYRKQPGNVQKFERLFTKHLFPFAMAETPKDVLSQVGLGNIDQVIPHHQQRAVQKLFVKFSGLDAPEQAMTGEGFLRAVKSLNLPPAGSSDEYLHSVLTSCHSLYSRQLKPSDEVSPDAVLEREVKFIPFHLLFQHCFGDSCFWFNSLLSRSFARSCSGMFFGSHGRFPHDFLN